MKLFQQLTGSVVLVSEITDFDSKTAVKDLKDHCPMDGCCYPRARQKLSDVLILLAVQFFGAS